MRMRGWIVVVCVSLAAVLIPQQGGPSATQEEVQDVRVTNFPGTQHVNGSVSVEGPVHQAALSAINDIEVPALLRPTDIRHLVPAGAITTDGFVAVVLSLTGQVKGNLTRPGEVGAILVPDVEPILDVLDEKGLFQFTLEVKAPSLPGLPYFHSDQPRFIVGFPRYRLLLYNTTERTVNVNLYAYLTS